MNSSATQWRNARQQQFLDSLTPQPLLGVYSQYIPAFSIGFKSFTFDWLPMDVKQRLYDRLPERVKPVVRKRYYQLNNKSPTKQLHAEFVDDVFDSRSEYQQYCDEFTSGSVTTLFDEALDEYRDLTGSDSLSGVERGIARDFYAVTRAQAPTTVVETGVCNGISTLSILLALQENESGQLYSIDYPLRADESLDEFRVETFDEYGGAAIPSDKDPGWIIPTELQSRWSLTVGKSQRELPRLLAEFDEIDMFIHDSEHSLPCMLFEFEIAYEWLTTEGIILADDINWNDAFSTFTEVRETVFGRLSHGVGYMRKGQPVTDT